jgi:hypothetical protein
MLLLVLVTLVATIAATVALHHLAAVRAGYRDRGLYWTRVIPWLALGVAPLLLASAAVEVLWPAYWRSGWHLHLDLAGALAGRPSLGAIVMLAVPLGVWAAAALASLATPAARTRQGRWLAGAVGFGDSRRWVLVFALPLAAVLIVGVPRLGWGPQSYPAAAWALALAMTCSLVALALSRPEAEALVEAPKPVDEATPAPALPSWPEALARHGVALHEVGVWPAGERARAAQGATAQALQARLARRGARGLAPEMVEAVADLLAPTRRGGALRVVFAPDECGQLELTAAAAEHLSRGTRATTLLVTPDGAATLAERLGRWLPRDCHVEAVEPGREPSHTAALWVVDAETLSDWLLPLCRDPHVSGGLGLTVWWDLHEYTGVRAANLWAISRRLHRMLARHGRPDARTLVFVRAQARGGAQLDAFVQRLLPQPVTPGVEVRIARRAALETHVYVLGDETLRSAEAARLEASYRHAALAAARASVESGWPTLLEVPEGVDEAEARAFRQLPGPAGVLDDSLRARPCEAGARFVNVPPADALTFFERVCQGGRTAVPAAPAQHVVADVADRGYVTWLLRRLVAAGDPPARRLVGAEAHPLIVKRHLLLALSEEPDTHDALRRTFLLHDDVIEATLRQLERENKLSHGEVRFLSPDGRLRQDRLYSSLRPAQAERRPLDTVGTDLIDVRHPAAGQDREAGVCLRVDPERVLIEAYPHRVFIAGGRRYRVLEWEMLDGRPARGWIECRPDGIFQYAWRRRQARLIDPRPREAVVGFGPRGRQITRVAVDGEYEETVTGAVVLVPGRGSGATSVQRPKFSRALFQNFATRALVLGFPEVADEAALPTLVQALREVLPVHLGVEEDALEVVRLDGEAGGRIATHGLAIVDLYPGGIGLIDAVKDDDALLLELLRSTLAWLRDAPDDALRTPAAEAVNPSPHLLQPKAAVKLLQQVL